MLYIQQFRNWAGTQVQSTGGMIPFWGMLFIGLYIFLTPFPSLTAIRNISFYLSIILLATHLFRIKGWQTLSNPFLIPVGLFVLWVFIGLFFAIDTQRSVHDFRAHLLNYVVLFCLLVVAFPTSSKLRILCWLIILSISISSLHEIYIWYFANGQPFSSRIALVNQQLPVGPIGMMALFSLILALGLLSFSSCKNIHRILLGICSVILVATIVFSQTRAVFLAMFIAFSILFLKRKRSYVYLLIIGIILSGYGLAQLRSITSVGSYTDRLTINYISYLLIKEHPVKGIGFGFGTFGDSKFIDHKHYLEQVPKPILDPTVTISSPHNLWVGMMVRTGLVGFCLFFTIYLSALYMGFRLARKSKDHEDSMWGRISSACLAALGIYGLFNVVSMHFLETLLWVSFFVAASSYQRNLTKK